MYKEGIREGVWLGFFWLSFVFHFPGQHMALVHCFSTFDWIVFLDMHPLEPHEAKKITANGREENPQGVSHSTPDYPP